MLIAIGLIVAFAILAGLFFVYRMRRTEKNVGSPLPTTLMQFLVRLL
jgi:hypothetical protein